MQFLSVFQTLLGLFPLIIQAIQTVEQAFPHAQAGQAKLAVVKGMVEHAMTVGTDVATTYSAIAPAVDIIAKGAVAIFNTAGVFHKSPPPQPVAPVAAPVDASTL